MKRAWEDIFIPDHDEDLQRMRVPGGWLYRSTRWHDAGPAVSMAFVPDNAPKVTPLGLAIDGQEG